MNLKHKYKTQKVNLSKINKRDDVVNNQQIINNNEVQNNERERSQLIQRRQQDEPQQAQRMISCPAVPSCISPIQINRIINSNEKMNIQSSNNANGDSFMSQQYQAENQEFSIDDVEISEEQSQSSLILENQIANNQNGLDQIQLVEKSSLDKIEDNIKLLIKGKQDQNYKPKIKKMMNYKIQKMKNQIERINQQNNMRSLLSKEEQSRIEMLEDLEDSNVDQQYDFRQPRPVNKIRFASFAKQQHDNSQKHQNNNIE